MAANKEHEVDNYVIKEKSKFGDVRIANDVIAIIAALAATEVKGVDKMAGNITNELVSKLGMNNLSKGVKVTVTPENVSVDLSLEIKYGFHVIEVSTKVQERVRSAIETMTGLTVSEVNVRIAGVTALDE
ncbi:MAG: Asp23/Gls24 family envelope stress response protein [Lachnospiraceae bacterium]